MTIDFSERGKVMFTIYDYISDMIEELPEDMNTGESSTSAGGNLFTTTEDDPEKLRKEEAITFHHVTEKLFYISKRAILDLQLGVAFLCTRVKDPDKDYWKKLTQVMKYIKSTIGPPLILGIDDTTTIRWYVDAAFGVHPDMKSHTQMVMTMGQGAASSN